MHHPIGLSVPTIGGVIVTLRDGPRHELSPSTNVDMHSIGGRVGGDEDPHPCIVWEVCLVYSTHVPEAGHQSCGAPVRNSGQDQSRFCSLECPLLVIQKPQKAIDQRNKLWGTRITFDMMYDDPSARLSH
jgi:hypothetical protein